MANGNEHCKCPGPNAISPTGMCPRCNVTGSGYLLAICAAIASGRQVVITPLILPLSEPVILPDDAPISSFAHWEHRSTGRQ